MVFMVVFAVALVAVAVGAVAVAVVPQTFRPLL
jgi:hypothetical protein